MESLVQKNRISLAWFAIKSIQIGLGNVFDLVISTIF
jgi:hypothetical protein